MQHSKHLPGELSQNDVQLQAMPASVDEGSTAWLAGARWQATVRTVGMKRPGDVPLPPRSGPSASRRAPSRRGVR